MPKVSFDYSSLIGAIAAKGKTREEMAKSLGMNPGWFGRKLREGESFNSSQIFLMEQLLDLEDLRPYFFTIKTQNL